MSNPYLPNSSLVQYPTAELNKFPEFINTIYADAGAAATVRHVDFTSQTSSNGTPAAYPLEELFEAMTFEEPTDSAAGPQLSVRYHRTLNNPARIGMDTHVKPYLATALETIQILSLESLRPLQVFLLHVFAIEPCKNVNLLTVPREWYSHVNAVIKETLEEALPAVNFNIKTVVPFSDAVRIGNPSEYNQGEDSRLLSFPLEGEASASRPVVPRPAVPRIDSLWQEPPQTGFRSHLPFNPRPTIDLEMLDPMLRGPQAASQYIPDQSLAGSGYTSLSPPLPTLPGPRPSPTLQPPNYQGPFAPRPGSTPQPSAFSPPYGPRPSQAFQSSNDQGLYEPDYSPDHQPLSYPASSGVRPGYTPLPPTYPVHYGPGSSHVPQRSPYQIPSGYSTGYTPQPSTSPALSGPHPGSTPLPPRYSTPYGPGPSHMTQPLPYPALSGPRHSPGPQVPPNQGLSRPSTGFIPQPSALSGPTPRSSPLPPTQPVLSSLRPGSSPQPRTDPVPSRLSTSGIPMASNYEEFFNAPSIFDRQQPTSRAPAPPMTLPAALPGLPAALPGSLSAPMGVSASPPVGSNPMHPQPWNYGGMASSSTATSPLVPQPPPVPTVPYDVKMPRCQSCIHFKKGCDRMRPCQNCSRKGKSADECIPEPASNAINGKYGVGSGYRTETWRKRQGGGGGGSAGATA